VEGDVGEPVAKSGTVVSFELIARDNGGIFFDHFESLFVVSKIATRATHEFRNSAVNRILPGLVWGDFAHAAKREAGSSI
jgi:hypothetical protein